MGLFRFLKPCTKASKSGSIPARPAGRKTSLWLAAVILLLVPIALPAQGFSNKPPVRRVLANGMVVILQENPSAPVVSIQVLVRTGSTDEKDQEAGIAHLHEHMLFKGTAGRGVGVIATEVEAAGGEINAYTSWENTVYFIDMASRFMDKGIDILADIIENAAFDPVELEKEKEVVLEEIRRSKDDPESRLSEAFFAKAYTVHPYRRPVIGLKETVQSVTRQDVLQFYRRWYVPENMIWVMAGNLDSERVLPLLESRLSRISTNRVPDREKIHEPPQTHPRAFLLQEDVKESSIRIGFHIPEITHPDVPALDLLAQILGQGRSSRLYQALRMQKRVVNSIGAYSMTPRDPGMLIVSASLETKDTGEALEGILKEVFRTAFEPIDGAELRRAKVQIERDFIYQQETVGGQARELAYYQNVSGDLEFGQKYLQRLREVRGDDILHVAKKYLDPGNMTIGVLLPTSSETTWTEETILAAAARAHSELEDTYERKTNQSEKSADPVVRLQLPNGARLLLKESHDVPLVSFRAAFLGGLLTESRETNGISSFTASLLTSGTSSRSASQIAEEIESLAGSLSGFSGRDSIGLTGEVVSWNFMQAFELFSDVLLHPSFPQEEIEKKRQDILAAIKNQEDNPAGLVFRLLWKALYDKCPYGMDPLGTAETIQKITRDELESHYRRHAVPNNLVLAVVGDLVPEDTVKAAEELLEGLPDDIPFERSMVNWKECSSALSSELTQRVSAEKLQAHLIVGGRGTIHTDPDRYSLAVLDAILSGQGGRLFLDLRDRQSLAYSVTSFTREGMEPGALGVYIATSPDKREQAYQGIHKQLRQIRDHKVSSEELERAKNYLIGTYELGLQSHSAQAAVIAHDELYGLGCEAYRHYAERVQAVTARDVRRVARKYLNAERLVKVLVLPESIGKNGGADETQTPSSGPPEPVDESVKRPGAAFPGPS